MAGEKAHLFRIGDFARLSRVSVKMLRHYDEIGLFQPCGIDQETGYRHYSAHQLPRLQRILALKDLGFSLNGIRQMLTGEPMTGQAQIREMLLARRAEIVDTIHREQQRLATLDTRLRQLDEDDMYDVVLRAVAPQLVAIIRGPVTEDASIASLFDEVECHTARHHARAARPPLVLYQPPSGTAIERFVDIAVPLTKRIPGTDRIIVAQLPGIAQAASVLHVGSYATMERATRALTHWIATNHYRRDGPLREVFLQFNADGVPCAIPTNYLTATPDRFVTEIQVPVTSPN